MTRNGVKIILPPLQTRPVSQQVRKRPVGHQIPKRPQTVGPVLTPLERLKFLRKIRRLQNVVGDSQTGSLEKAQKKSVVRPTQKNPKNKNNLQHL